MNSYLFQEPGAYLAQKYIATSESPKILKMFAESQTIPKVPKVEHFSVKFQMSKDMLKLLQPHSTKTPLSIHIPG